MKLSRLASRDNYRDVEKEWKYEYIYYILSNIGLPDGVDKYFPEDGIDAFTVEHRIALKNYINKYHITIVDDRDGGIKIFLREDVVAEWKKCTFVLREDPKEVDPSKRLYIEIIANVWASFDEEDAE